MAEAKKSNANSANIPTRIFRENKAMVALLLIAGFAVIFTAKIRREKSEKNAGNICSGGEIAIASGQTRKARIHPYCWSEFSAPLKKDIAVVGEKGKSFRVCFWSERLKECLSRPESVQKSRWFGDIRASSFRVMGDEGFVAVTAQ